jgi:hypothetical protein
MTLMTDLALDPDPIKLNRIRVQFFRWSMIFSENRLPLFRIMPWRRQRVHPVTIEAIGKPGDTDLTSKPAALGRMSVEKMFHFGRRSISGDIGPRFESVSR